MGGMKIPSIVLAAVMVALAVPCAAGEGPASAPAAVDENWGPAEAGVSVSAVAEGKWALGGPWRLRLAIRNTGSAPVDLPDKDGLVVFLMLAQGRTGHFTEKLLPARNLPDWPDKLAAGQVVQLGSVDAAGLEVAPYDSDLKLHEGYPARFVDDKPTAVKPAGKAGAVLKPGSLKVRPIAWLPRGAERPLSLKGPTLSMELGLDDFAALPPERQKQVLADLAAKLRQDAFAAQAAHGEAVKIGAPAVETVKAVATDAKAPDFARMWATTALADIGGKDAAAAVTAALADRDSGVRYVAAYHGVKLKDEAFEKALLARAAAGEDAMLTAWAIMGFLRFRGQAPPELLAAGVESDQWKARAAVAEVFSRTRPTKAQLPILRKLARDENAQIRVTAAKALASSGDASFETIDALMAALDAPGDDARHAAATALAKLTGKPWSYDRSAPAEEQKKALDQWRLWWKGNKAAYHKGD